MWKGIVILLLASPAIAFNLSDFFAHGEITYQYWGPGDSKPDTLDIKPFKIDVPEKLLDDLNGRLDNWKASQPRLDGAAWTYGLPSNSARNILDYWRNNYTWSQRQEMLNKYPQFTTEVQGLNVHFYHVKPTLSKDSKMRVLPLLIVHGWPGSVVEFQKAIPLLTTPQVDHDFVFEVVVPSIPGFGFSSGATRTGFGLGPISLVLKNLMLKLGFKKFYTQGGDLGSWITAALAGYFPDNVIGFHSNFCTALTVKGNIWYLLGAVYPPLVVEKKYVDQYYPLTRPINFFATETGYFLEQASKPDTVGIGLSDSPAGLAAWILEKFSTWTNMENKLHDDGNLDKKFTMDELLDNVMIYWITNSITTSMRAYKENFSSGDFKLNLQSIPIKMPSGCAQFPHETVHLPEKVLKQRFKKLMHYTHPPRGGHFAAFEEPELYTKDVYAFVNKSETYLRK